MGNFTTTPRTVSVGQENTAAGYNTHQRGLAEAFGAWTSYTPTWGSTGTAPAIGSGTLIGFWTQVQKTVLFRVGVTFGGTTTFGTGNYTLTLPVAPSSSLPYWSWIGYGLQSSTYQLTLDANGGSATAVMNYQSSTAGVKTRVGATAPVTWTATSGNGFWFSGSYETA